VNVVAERRVMSSDCRGMAPSYAVTKFHEMDTVFRDGF
jgi:hypothetical protein